LPIPERI
jgi:hypothetical protein